MREIKFRVWDKERKIMEQVRDLDFRYGEYSVIIHEPEYIKKLLNTELMQFTGLKDKNGKDVYEGDIIAHKNPEWLGGFQQKWVIKFKEFSDEYEDYIGYRILKENEEVIGNIYENPELLK